MQPVRFSSVCGSHFDVRTETLRSKEWATIALIGTLTGGLAFCQAAPSVRVSRDTLFLKSAALDACPASQAQDGILASASRLLQQANFQQAVQLLQSELALRCNPTGDLLLAAALEGAGNIPEARHTLERAHAVWPSNIDLATSLARYDLQEGNFPAAEQSIRLCKPTSSTPLRELQVMAMTYLENQDLSRALSVAGIAFHAYPSEQTLLFTANVLQIQGRFMNVVALLRKYRKDYANSPPFLITIAESEYDAMMYKAARQDAEHAIALAPDSYPAHYLLGNVLVKMGDLKSSIEEYRKAIAISPQEPRTYYHLGLTIESEGKTDEAKDYFQKAIQADDRYAPAYCEIGKLQLRSHELHDAAQNLSLAIQYNPAFQESYYLLIQTYARLGERSKSQAVMAQWSAYKKSHHLRPAGLNQKNPLADHASQ